MLAFRTRISNKRRWTIPGLMFGFLAFTCFSFAATPQDGYFYGIDMEPVGSADIAAVESEPAVALVFAVDQKTAAVTEQFDAWFQSPDRPQVSAFAIGVVPDGLSREVALTAIQQRDLHMPVFLAGSDLLLGDDFRLVVLNNDMEIARFLTLDWADAYEALESAGVSVTSPPPATIAVPTPTPAPVAVPATPTPAVVIEPALPTPAVVTTTPVTTTTVVTPVEPLPDEGEPLVLGGKDSDGIYINKLYGMRVQFPPGWQYQVSGKRDGAVAVEPRGSQMDMRIWATPSGNLDSPQDYVDQRLESIAEKNKTRIHVERHVRVLREGLDSVDVTYTYTKPLDEDAPARGGLVWRGRMLVVLDDGFVKAAGVKAPGGEFMAAYPLIQSFIHSFQVIDGDKNSATGYSDPNFI